MKPVIGITMVCKPDPGDARTGGLLQLYWNYPQVVSDYGAIPVLIPPQADPEEMAGVLDGLLIPGGGDFDPTLYGEALHPAADDISPERYRYERAVFDALDPDVPVLGICYGCQFINVARGGSLIQHLPEVVGHEADSSGLVQEYQLVEGTQLRQTLGGASADGQSWHHQAVGRVGQNLRVSAWNQDGTVEALEATDRPWMIGVQWHPERTASSDTSRAIFESFIQAAREYRARRTPHEALR